MSTISKYFIIQEPANPHLRDIYLVIHYVQYKSRVVTLGVDILKLFWRNSGKSRFLSKPKQQNRLF